MEYIGTLKCDGQTEARAFASDFDSVAREMCHYLSQYRNEFDKKITLEIKKKDR